MDEKIIAYLKIQIDLKKITREEVLAKFPQFEGRL
jgi:hypothetical protein